MNKLPFPSIKANQDFQKSFSALVRKVHQNNLYQTLTPRNIHNFAHGSGWRTHSGDESAKELSEIEKHSTEFSLSFTDVVQQNLAVLPRLISDITQSMHSGLMQSMYSKIHQATQQTGNIVTASQAGSNAKAVIEMLNKIEFGVDENGNVSMPEIHVPSGSTIFEDIEKEGAAFEKEMEEIIERKKISALQKEQDRLSKFKKP